MRPTDAISLVSATIVLLVVIVTSVISIVSWVNYLVDAYYHNGDLRIVCVKKFFDEKSDVWVIVFKLINDGAENVFINDVLINGVSMSVLRESSINVYCEEISNFDFSSFLVRAAFVNEISIRIPGRSSTYIRVYLPLSLVSPGNSFSREVELTFVVLKGLLSKKYVTMVTLG